VGKKGKLPNFQVGKKGRTRDSSWLIFQSLNYLLTEIENQLRVLADFLKKQELLLRKHTTHIPRTTVFPRHPVA
jgi:hypothetical protein